jgi:WD40 repeat protein
MPIPLLSLDDRTFDDLVDEVQALIPRHAPAWTNHNISDPGIMLLELFAWVTEAMVYRINRITPASRVRFLELLGAIFQPAQPAVLKLEVTAYNLAHPWVLKRHTPISARTDRHATPVMFETTHDLRLTPGAPAGIVTARQCMLVREERLGVSDQQPYQLFKLKQAGIVLPKEPFPRRPQVVVGEERWVYQASLRKSGPNDKHFTVKPWLNAIVFGDNMHGRTPEPGLPVKVTYRTDPAQLRVIRNELAAPRGGTQRVPALGAASNGTSSYFPLRHPLLALDLQEPDEFEPLLLIDNQPWEYRSSFLDLAAGVSEFTVEPWANGVRFGEDRDHGRIPPVNGNIVLTYRHTLGALGNVQPGTAFSIQPDPEENPPKLRLSDKIKFITPGVDRTELDAARDQVFAILKPHWRAITDLDFQELITQNHSDIVRATPVAGQDLTSETPGAYRAGHVSIILTPRARYELSQPQHDLGKICAISPDGRRLLDLPDDQTGKTLGLWDLENNQKMNSISAGSLIKAQFSPDSRRLVTSTDDEAALLWNAENGERLAELTQAGTSVFSQDGQHLATISSDLKAFLWGTENGATIALLSVPSLVETSIFSPAAPKGARWLATLHLDKTVRLWNAVDGRLSAIYPHENTPKQVIFSPTGDHLATLDDKMEVRLWRTQTSPPLAALAHKHQILALAVLSDRLRFAALGDNPHTIEIWDAQDAWALKGKTLVKSLVHDAAVHAVSFSPDGEQVAFAAGASLYLWNVEDASPKGLDEFSAPVSALFFNLDGNLLAIGVGSSVYRYQLADASLTRLADYSANVSALYVDKEKTLVASIADTAVTIFTRPTTGDEHESEPLRHPAPVNVVRFSADGHLVTTVAEDNIVRVWDRAQGKEIAVYNQPAAVVTLTANTYGQQLVTAGLDPVGDDHTIQLWRIENEKPVAVFPHEEPVKGLAFSPDGTRLVTWGNHAQVWSTRSRQKLASLVNSQGETVNIEQIVFDPTNHLLAIVATKRDGTGETGLIQLWSPRNGARLGELAQDGPIKAVVFNPNGQRLVALGHQNRVWIWKLSFRPQEPVIVETELLLALADMDALWLNAKGGWLATLKENLLSTWDIGRGKQSSTFYHDHRHNAIRTFTPTLAEGHLLVTGFDSEEEGVVKRIVRVWNSAHVVEVQALLAARGLITSRHHVAGVGYTDICIAATIVRSERVTQVAVIQEAICTALREFFHPLQGGPERKGWPLARTVHASEVYQIIEGVEGVDHVETLSVMLCGEAEPAPTSLLAHIAIPAHHLVNCRVQPNNFTIVAPSAVAVQHRVQRGQPVGFA